jgi:hypothetical protein
MFRWTRVALLEFDRDRKSSSVIVTPVTGGSNVLLVRGSSVLLVLLQHGACLRYCALSRN